ncbi:c-type cytochrome [Dyadobacter chenwenxiniae]|uniref:C-type cytochrome n=1 Tax=Dyadobacter chenwenxiniae TaxID=2906456 RepID=A0A9X1TMP3_9BACT|nr:c-type cytochrome [Dyadobacter chenwenxiniae]MCF0063748.1 c-type cytochrome [Dyadobacter chenwenxiniae]UON83423.1 c-type cytochrome [Dyadobacter chenwenxiniae]
MRTIYIVIAAAIWLTCAANTQKQARKGLKTTEVLRHESPQADLVKRGEYLVTIMGCADCHSPKKLGPQGPVPDMERFLSGFDSAQPLGAYDKNVVKTGQWVIFNAQNTAFAGPWGVSFAANLTPDDTGIGTWTFEQFNLAMRKGKFKGIQANRPLLPPMPWQNYTKMSSADMKAIFVYLKSLKPVPNVVPAHLPPGQI